MFARITYGRGANLFEFVDEFMNEQPNTEGLAVNWLMFGSSGHVTKPEGGMLKNFTRCAEKDFERNHIIKTICDPMKVFCWSICPHYPTYKKGFCNLDENGDPVEKYSTRHVHFEKIRINHYCTRSKEEYMEKITRGRADVKGVRDMSGFYEHDRNEQEDTEILERI